MHGIARGRRNAQDINVARHSTGDGDDSVPPSHSRDGV